MDEPEGLEVAEQGRLRRYHRLPCGSPMTDIASIARGLTKAQREALNPPDHGPFATSIHCLTRSACRCALQRKGLVVNRMYATSLTPLGLRVRAFLRGEGNG